MQPGESDATFNSSDVGLGVLLDQLERMQESFPRKTKEEIRVALDEACKQAAQVRAALAHQTGSTREERSDSQGDEVGWLRKVGAYLVSLIIVAGVLVGVALLGRFGTPELADWAVMGILLVAMSVFGGWLYRLLAGLPRTGIWYFSAFLVGFPMLVVSACLAAPI
ncbi:MAG: hypothetical protein V1912_01470 [bacterium]